MPSGGYRVVERPPTHTEPCACGGMIGVLMHDLNRPEPEREKAIGTAIDRHRRSTLHQEWLRHGGQYVGEHPFDVPVRA